MGDVLPCPITIPGFISELISVADPARSVSGKSYSVYLNLLLTHVGFSLGPPITSLGPATFPDDESESEGESSGEEEVRDSLRGVEIGKKSRDDSPESEEAPPSPPLRVTRSAAKKKIEAPPKPSRRGKKKPVSTRSTVSLGPRVVEAESDQDSVKFPAPKSKKRVKALSRKKAGKAKERSTTPLPDPIEEASFTPPPVSASMEELLAAIPSLDAPRVRSVEQSLLNLRLVSVFIFVISCSLS